MLTTSRLALFAGLINRASKSIQRLKAAKMKRYDLSAAHTACLCRLAEAGEAGLTQSELAGLEGMNRAQVCRVLGELQSRGYALPAAQDGRYKKRYCLTGAGRTAAGEIDALILSINRFVSGCIPEGDIEVFYRTLTRIAENLERAEAEFL